MAYGGEAHPEGEFGNLDKTGNKCMLISKLWVITPEG